MTTTFLVLFTVLGIFALILAFFFRSRRSNGCGFVLFAISFLLLFRPLGLLFNFIQTTIPTKTIIIIVLCILGFILLRRPLYAITSFLYILGEALFPFVVSFSLGGFHGWLWGLIVAKLCNFALSYISESIPVTLERVIWIVSGIVGGFLGLSITLKVGMFINNETKRQEILSEMDNPEDLLARFKSFSSITNAGSFLGLYFGGTQGGIVFLIIGSIISMILGGFVGNNIYGIIGMFAGGVIGIIAGAIVGFVIGIFCLGAFGGVFIGAFTGFLSRKH